MNSTVNKKMKINWMNTSFLTALPVAAFTWFALHVYYNGVCWSDIALLIGMYFLTGLGITAGYHRCFSHRAFKCRPVIEFFFLISGAAALENTALNWSADHRRHHRHVDGEGDPYSIKKGFFWAHMGWIFFDSTDDSGNDMESERLNNVADLKKSKLIRWQHKYYLPIAVIAGFGIPMAIGALFGRPIAGLIWGGLIRQVFTHHSTFLINSAAHFFGKKTYSVSNTSRDSWWLAYLSFGEGYHNFHHTFPSDYRNGVRWYQWDPTKWLIRTLSFARLSWDLRRTSKETIINHIINQRRITS